jgi:hypothetical protein
MRQCTSPPGVFPTPRSALTEAAQKACRRDATSYETLIIHCCEYIAAVIDACILRVPPKMFSPLDVLGLVSNIVQLVDIASRVLSKSSELRRHGQLVQHSTIESEATKLAQMSTSLQEAIKRSNSKLDEPSKDAQVGY